MEVTEGGIIGGGIIGGFTVLTRCSLQAIPALDMKLAQSYKKKKERRVTAIDRMAKILI